MSMWKTPEGQTVASGCLHMHTRFSDGSGDVIDLAHAAGEAGLDYIIITDHMDLRALPAAGRHGNVHVLVGYEHNDLNSHNHLLALGVKDVLPADLPPEEIAARVKLAGGFGIIAHPDERRAHMPNLPPYPWTAWANSEFDGIELWNQMSEWAEHLTRWNRFTRVWSPRKALYGPSERILYLWDVLNTQRPVVGVAGVDAHAYPYRVGPLRFSIFPYKVHFRTLQTHVIFDHEPPADTARFEHELVENLRSCRVYFANERWGGTRGFRLWVECDGEAHTGGARVQSCYSIGSVVPVRGDIRLHAIWPKSAYWQLVYNGFPMQKGVGKELSTALERPGSYRLALYRHGRAWLFTNHIRLVDAA